MFWTTFAPQGTFALRGYTSHMEVNNVKRLIIHRLLVQEYSPSLNLSHFTSYTIEEISLDTMIYPAKTYTPVRGGLPTNISDAIRTTSESFLPTSY